MPYTDPWNTTRPAGSVAAKNIDDEIRVLRLQLQERFNDVLFVDMADDPLVLKDEIKGLVVGAQKVVPFTAFNNNQHARENNLNTDGYIIGFVDGGSYCAPIDVPAGCVVTKIEWLISRDAASSVDCRLKKKPFAAGAAAATVVDSTNVNSVATPSLTATPDLNETISGSFTYYLDVKGNGDGVNSFKIFAARITFNRDTTEHAS